MPASMQGEMQPTIYRFKLGGFEVATIMDSKVIRSGLSPSFGGEAAASEVKALAAETGAEPGADYLAVHDGGDLEAAELEAVDGRLHFALH